MSDLANLFMNSLQVHPLMRYSMDAGSMGAIPTNMLPAPPRPMYNPAELDKQRHDSTRLKETGFYGELGNPNTAITEYSLGGGGGRPYYPSIYPGMTGKQLQSVLNEALSEGKKRFPQSIEDAAWNSAQDRIAQGLSPFWNEAEDGRFKR